MPAVIDLHQVHWQTIGKTRFDDFPKIATRTQVLDLAEREGFEPPDQEHWSTVFKTAAFDHSATSPMFAFSQYSKS